MNHPTSDDRILRLNAALDGELDAASSLELEREMAANPALAAEYRRLEALRASMARLVQRETAPKALADRIAALGAPADGAIQTIDGYHVARWSDASLAYVAVSDMDEQTLAEFVAAFRQAGKPASEAPAK
jgi:anti-sigma factor RsiW